MAYCGILDGLTAINGNPVDLDRLEEGIITAGDETFDADEFITDEDKLEMFNEGALRTKGELLEDIDSLLGTIDDESKDGRKHSQAYYTRYRDLVEKFKAEVEKTIFPEKLEDWWEYGYTICESGATLTLSHLGSYDVHADDTVSCYVDTEFKLLETKSRLLTVDEYAQSYGVTATTVRQWIRRGKIRSAIKMGSEWRIPELAEILDRGYQYAYYHRKEHLSDLPAEYAFFNDYDYVEITQDKEHKNQYNLNFGKKFDVMKYPESEWEQFYRRIQLSQQEREKFELYLIGNPFVEANESVITFR